MIFESWSHWMEVMMSRLELESELESQPGFQGNTSSFSNLPLLAMQLASACRWLFPASQPFRPLRVLRGPLLLYH